MNASNKLKRLFFSILLSGLSINTHAQSSSVISVKNPKTPEAFSLSSYPILAPTAEFMNEHGQKTSLRDFRGKILLVNIWSTSCAQCVIELPMLDRLQNDMGGVKFQVIALSSDLEPLPVLRRFWVNRGIKHLKIFADPQAHFATAANVKGLPTTFLIDEEGREIGRIKGIAEWNGPIIKAQIRLLIRKAKEKEQKKQQESLKEKETTPNQEKTADSSVPSPVNDKKDIQSWFKK